MRSFDAVKLVLDHAPKDLSPVQRLILIQIAHRQPKCYPSIEQIANDVGLKSGRTVSAATKVLASRNLIIIRRRFKSTNEYFLNPAGIRNAVQSNNNSSATTVLSDDKLNRSETAVLYPRPTALKQTINKQVNKQAFFMFLENFPNRSVDEEKVFKAWLRALRKNASEDLLIAASQTNKEKLEPDAWLNFEKWKGFVAEVDEIALLRDRSI